MHVRRGKPSEYGIRLREKQKLKRFYGVFERQFRRYFSLASRSTENTGEVLLSIMERRLDNVVHRLGFAPNRAVPGSWSRTATSTEWPRLNIPSLLVKPGDTIRVKERRTASRLVKLYLQESPPPVPDYLDRSSTEPPEGRMTRMPTRGDVDPHIQDIREQLIIEFAGR